MLFKFVIPLEVDRKRAFGKLQVNVAERVVLRGFYDLTFDKLQKRQKRVDDLQPCEILVEKTEKIQFLFRKNALRDVAYAVGNGKPFLHNLFRLDVGFPAV